MRRFEMKLQGQAKNSIQLRSQTGGRTRWEVEGLMRNPFLAGTLQTELGHQRGIIKFSANTTTGRVLIVFNPVVLGIEAIRALLAGVLNPTAKGESNGNGNGHSNGNGNGNGAAVALAHRNGSQKARPLTKGKSELYELVKFGEGSPALRWKAVGYSFVNTAFKLLSPLSLGLMTTVAISGPLSFLARFGLTGRMTQMFALVGLTLLSRALESMTGHRKNRAWSVYSQNVEHSLREASFRHAQVLDMKHLDGQSTEKMMSVIGGDTDKIKQFLSYTPQILLEKCSLVVAGSVMMLLISPVAFILNILPVPILIYLNRRQREETVPKYGLLSGESDEVNRIVANSLNGASTVKSFTAEDREAQRMAMAGKRQRTTSVHLERQNSYYSSLGEFTFFMGIILPLVYGTVSLLRGSMSILRFMTQAYVSPTLLTAATGFEPSLALYQEAKQAGKRVRGLLDTPAEDPDEGESLELDSVRGDLAFSGVSFGYADEDVLRDINLRIPQGGLISFVGPTGSGKSTLVKLLLRFYACEEGLITLDGVDVRTLNLRDLRRAIGLVSQDTFLFNGTVYDNIAFGNPDATFDEVVEASRAAEAFEFIDRLPDGFNSDVGDRGQKLSGGQRQRISIARAILKKPPILILDEATSSVDNETEAAIKKSIERLSEQCTVIVIAHRLSTVCNSDKIYYVKDSRITESGTHDDLVDLDGDYAKLWKLQTADQKVDEVPVAALT